LTRAVRQPSANRIKFRCGAYNRKENIMSNNQRTLFAYSVKERGEGRQAIWTKIGAVFEHGKGKGMTIQLDALPIGDRIVLREPKDDKTDAKAS
jgi:hypothetical protein